MQVTRTSMLTGITHTREISVAPEQLSRYFKGEGLIQDIFPTLNADDREFIKSGITPQEWDTLLIG